jgi:hypothetical protein
VSQNQRCPRPTRGGPIDIGEVPTSGGFRYKPTTRYVDPSELAPGVLGDTDVLGNIRISNVLVGKEKWATLFHEKVHQFLTPKLAFLRKFRLGNMQSSYVRSSLWRYIEEALSQTFGQMKVDGLEGIPRGIRFPVERGYVYIRFPGAEPIEAFEGLAGKGLVPELPALLYTGTASGVAFRLYHIRSASMDGAEWYRDFYKESFAGDTSIRNWVFSNSVSNINAVEPGMKASMVNRLLDGWISDEDLNAIAIIYRSINIEYERAFVREILGRRLNDVSDLGQRNKVRMLIEG